MTVTPNTEEVQDTEWVGRGHLQEFIKDLESRNVGITPWFRLCTKVRTSLSLHPQLFVPGIVALLVEQSSQTGGDIRQENT